VDRDPAQFLHYMKYINRHGATSSRVVALGDAVHAMSPFKGQGANQALADGPLLASWLTKSTIDCALKGFMREMIQRTQKKVSSSREAALFLHSKEVLTPSSTDSSCGHNFAGVPTEFVPKLLSELKEREIGAHYGFNLDSAIRDVIVDLLSTAKSVKKEAATAVTTTTINNEQKDSIELSKQKALAAAAIGNTKELRALSMLSSLHSEIIRTAVDDKKRTCLHLAALGGHYHACRWLISEVNVDVDAVDENGTDVLGAAEIGGNDTVISLLRKSVQ